MSTAKAKKQISSPIAGDTPSVTIAGKTYPMRRLTVRDTFKLARILAASAANMTGNLESMEGGDMVGLLLGGLLYSEDECLALMASLIGIELSEFEAMPMGSEMLVAEAVVKHQDMRAFLEQLGKVLGGMGVALPKGLTSSAPATAGATTTSSASAMQDSSKS